MHIKPFLAAIIATLVLCIPSHAAQLSYVVVPSDSMHKEIPVAVLLPAGYSTHHKTRCPVIYFLDGYSGDGQRILTGICKDTAPQQADEFNVILVAVGSGNSWYFDSPINTSSRWQTFLTKELIPYIDSHYKTIHTREGRAITGLSMGGHGAFYTAFRHPDLFLAAGATSGGVDIRPFPKNWDIAKQLGTLEEHPGNWETNTVINNLDGLPSARMSLIFDCGQSDFFLSVNRSLDKRLTDMGVKHTYTEYPGAHNQEYWSKSFPLQVEFFARAFKSASGSGTNH